MTQDPTSPDSDAPDAEEEDQDAGPTTMAPPGEGADTEGQVG
jgi:hypothetical protein